MAVNPVQMKQMPKGSKLMKTNTLSHELTKRAFTTSDKGTIQEFVKTHDLSKNMVKRQAPRRANDYTDIEGSWIYAGIEYLNGEDVSYSMTGLELEIDSIVEDKGYCMMDMGAWPLTVDPDGDGTEYAPGNYGVLNAVGYFKPADDTFGIIGGWMAAYFLSGTKESPNPSTYKLNWKTWYAGICDADGNLPQSEEESENLVAQGTVDWNNGIIELNGMFGPAQAWLEESCTITRSMWNSIANYYAPYGYTSDEDVIFIISNYYLDLTSNHTVIDSTYQAGPSFVGDNMLILPNAFHNFDQVRKGTLNDTVWVQVPHVYELEEGGDTTIYSKEWVYDTAVNITEPVFVYQSADNATIYTWNLWGIANIPNVELTLDADGIVAFPFQPVNYADMSYYTEAYSDLGYIFSNNHYNFGWTYAPYNEDGIQGVYELDINSDDTPCELNDDRDVIMWDANYVLDIVRFEGDSLHYAYGIGYHPFINNMLTLDMPLVLPEPTETWKLGDVNHDTFVNVADVTALIKYILSSGVEPEVFYVEQANVSGDAAGEINVADVTALIQLILSAGN